MASCSSPALVRGSSAHHVERALGEARELGVRDTVERLWHALGGPR
jgi:hypothetical protein